MATGHGRPRSSFEIAERNQSRSHGWYNSLQAAWIDFYGYAHFVPPMFCHHLNSQLAGSRAYHRSLLSRVENWGSPLHFARSYCTSWCGSGLVRQHHADHEAHRLLVEFLFPVLIVILYWLTAVLRCWFVRFCIFYSSMPHIPLRGEAFTHFQFVLHLPRRRSHVFITIRHPSLLSSPVATNNTIN
jgi:hypothetical protein